MKPRRALALSLTIPLLSSCFGGIQDYNTESVQLTSNVADWRDEVIYQLLVDRFADGDTGNDFRVDRGSLGHYQGGDWQGVADHMDYIQNLGVTTLWISPIVRNVDTDAGFDAYHGYWAQDLTLLNPHFGDIAALRRMIREAHSRHIKVILDIVTNHMGQMFFYDVNNNGRPDENVAGAGPTTQYQNPGGGSSPVTRTTEYDPDYNSRGRIQAFTSLGPAGDAPVVFFNMPDIFRVRPRTDILASQSILARPEGYHRRGRIISYNNEGDQPSEQVMQGDFPGGLKDVATELPQVRLAMIEAYWRWVELLDLDGFRIDTLKHVEHGFWQNFGAGIRQRAMRAGKRNFLMFGEAFDGNDALVGSYTNPNEMDSVFYFPQKYRVFDNIFQCGNGATHDAELLRGEREMHYGSTPQPLGVGVAPRSLLVNFMDNHDVSRFLYGMNPTVVHDIRYPCERPESERPASCAATPNQRGPDCSSGLVNAADPRDVERFRPRLHVALTYLLTEDGIPCIYYGTEQDFTGGNDPSNRERMWETDFQIGGVARPGGAVSTFNWIQRLTGLRRRYQALRRGSMAFTWTTTSTDMAGSDTGMMAFERVDGANYALVVLHAFDGTHRTTSNNTSMTVHQPPGTELVNVLGTQPATATVAGDGTLAVELGAWQSAVFVPRSQMR